MGLPSCTTVAFIIFVVDQTAERTPRDHAGHRCEGEMRLGCPAREPAVDEMLSDALAQMPFCLAFSLLISGGKS